MSEERRSPERKAPLLDSEPELVIQFRDPITRASGYAVIDTLSTGCAYGAVRIQPGARWTDLAPLARIATVRYQLARVWLERARALGSPTTTRTPPTSTMSSVAS